MFMVAYRRLRRLVGPLVIAAALSGCGASYREQRFQPIAPEGAPPLIRTHITGVLQFDLGGATMSISSVVQSERLAIVYAAGLPIPTPLSEEQTRDEPLRIAVDFRISRGSIRIDPHHVTVVDQGTGRELRPVSTALQSRYWTGSNWNPVTQAVSAELELKARDRSWDFLIFTYDIAVRDLKPFTLQIGRLDYNGEAVRIPPIPFKLKTALTSS